MLSISAQYKSINRISKLYNGGFATYWNLYKKLLEQFSKKEELLSKIRTGYPQLVGDKLERKIKWEFFKLQMSAYTWLFVWACILKPFGQFVSRTVVMEGQYVILDDRDFHNVNIKKSTTYRLFGIKFWKAKNQYITEKDLKEIADSDKWSLSPNHFKS